MLETGVVLCYKSTDIAIGIRIGGIYSIIVFIASCCINLNL